MQDCLNDYCAHIGKPYGWDWFETLSDEDARILGQTYLDCCSKLFVQGMPRLLVDKTPLNVFELGFAKRVLPNASFVFMSRHPLDVGLSNYSTNFHAAHPYSKTLASIGEMTRTVYLCAEDYRRKLGGSFRWQSYRALVSSPEPQIRALLGHLELDWNPACLAPERRDGAVKTASVFQVRSKINKGAVAKWVRFENELQPLVAALGGQEWIESWTAADKLIENG